MRKAFRIGGAAVLAAAMVGVGAWAANASVVTGLDASRATVLQYTNQLRAAVGASSLSEDSRLDAIAQDWAQTMADQGMLWHNPCAFEKMGVLTDTMGENVAFGAGSDDQTIVTNVWRNSPGHYANIIDTGFSTIGIGKAYSSTGMPYWVQDFGGVITVTNEQSDLTSCSATIAQAYTDSGTTPQPVSSVLPSAAPQPEPTFTIVVPSTLPTPLPSVPVPTVTPQPGPSTTPGTTTLPVAAKPSNIPGLKATGVTRHGASLRWGVPTLHYPQVTYRVRLYQGKHLVESMKLVNLTHAQFVLLRPHTSYTVKIYASNSKGSSATRQLAFKTH